MFGIGPIEMLIVGALLLLFVVAGIVALVVFLMTQNRREPDMRQFEALEQENRRLREEVARLKSQSS